MPDNPNPLRNSIVERIGRSANKYNKIPEELLILFCEEDYNICVPLIERGAAVHSSELLLCGIVVQKLEYERSILGVARLQASPSEYIG